MADRVGVGAGSGGAGGRRAAAGGGGTVTGSGGTVTGSGGTVTVTGGGGTGAGTELVIGSVGSVTVGRVSVGSCGTLWPEAVAVQKPSTAIVAKTAPRQIKWSRRNVSSPSRRMPLLQRTCGEVGYVRTV